MLRLYDNLVSGNAYKVRLILRLLGIPFERVEVDIVRGESRSSPTNPRLRWIIWGVLVLGVVAVLAPLGFNPFR